MTQYRTRLSMEEVRERLRPLICRRTALPPDAAYHDVLPGFVMTAAIQTGERIDFLPRETLDALGGWDSVRGIVIHNLRLLRQPTVEITQAVPGRNDSAVYLVRDRDPFGAARMFDLNTLIGATFAKPATHGVLISVPNWYITIVHVPSGPGVLKATPLMAQLAYGLMQTVPPQARLDESVYFLAPDGRIQRVAYGAEGAGVNVEMRGLIAEVLLESGWLSSTLTQ